MTTMLANTTLTMKWIAIGTHFVFGGAFVSPFLFILGDIIAELYGFNIAKITILFGFICQSIFATILQLTIKLHSPVVWHEQHSFNLVFGHILRINLSGLLAYAIGCTLNAKLISQWKIILHGKHFGLRSIGASSISEACYSAIAILMIGLGSLPFNDMINVILLSYLIKLIFSVVISYPANILVIYMKQKLDFPEVNSITYNPFINNNHSEAIS